MKSKSPLTQELSCLSITEKAVKFLQAKHQEVIALKAVPLAHKTDDEITRGLDALLRGAHQKRLGRFILLIPRHLAALHYVRLPSAKPDEIRQMARLQAGKQLPYEPHTIILGYQIIRVTPEGYSDVLLVIVHQDIVNRYLKLLEKYKVAPQEVILDAQGVPYWLMSQKDIGRDSPVAVVDLDAGYARLDISLSGMIMYSRAFALNVPAMEYTPRLVEEIIKSFSAYDKETIAIKPERIIITGCEELLQGLDAERLKQLPYAFQICPQQQGIHLSPSLSESIPELKRYSFVSLAGAALAREWFPFNLLPDEHISKRQKVYYTRQLRLSIGLICGILLTAGIGMFLNVSARQTVITRLKTRFQSVSGDVDQIERMSKKLNYVKTQLQEAHACLDILTEIYRVATADVNLIFFGYDTKKDLVLKGQAKTLSGVFDFVNALEASDMFKGVQVKYSSKKKIKNEEIANFEIACPMEAK